MSEQTAEVLEVLAEYGIRPLEDDFKNFDLPGIGEIGENEEIYTTSLSKVFGGNGDERAAVPQDLVVYHPRLRELQEELEQEFRSARRSGKGRKPSHVEAPEPSCGWYCPIHFFGHGWGIFIREECVLRRAAEIGGSTDLSRLRIPLWQLPIHLVRAAFYSIFLHEQFHHKVESLGFRLLIASGSDRFRPYKRDVYAKTFLTSDCLEESLANAESYRRLNEDRYVKKLDPAVRAGLRRFLKNTIPFQPPGYREGVKYFADNQYRDGLYTLQSMVRDGLARPNTPPHRWSIAPNVVTSLADITEGIYVIVPRGAQPLFMASDFSPGATASTYDVQQALTRHYGYQKVSGGKGSHVKLSKPGLPPIVLPGNRRILAPGVVRQVLRQAVGEHPLSHLPEFLAGKLPAIMDN